ncbi:MAG: DUF5050 domain-containing protein [Clostridia bacterium]|nr:DUF5050 domain-containing protein [Clostridia bacterium]
MKKIKISAVIISAVMLMTALFTGCGEKLPENNDPNFAVVPNIVGMTAAEAEKAVDDAGLILKTEFQFNSPVKEGLIISHDMEGEKRIGKYSVITAKVSAGKANKSGTTPSNANNFGKVTSQGDWIYFSGYESGIYKMRKDKSEKQLIIDAPLPVGLNVVGEWIYYTEATEEGGMYKVRIDGKYKKRISTVTSYNLYVHGDWIYYMTEYWGGKICKMRTDGSDTTLLVSDKCWEFVVSGDHIYYVKRDDKQVYRCRLDGEGKCIFSNGFIGRNLSLVGDKFAVSNMYDVLHVNYDGTGQDSFGTHNVQYGLLNGYKGWLYYLEYDFRDATKDNISFGRMKPDGSEKKTIHTMNQFRSSNPFFNVVDDWIYFEDQADNNALYRVKVDGTGLEKIV